MRNCLSDLESAKPKLIINDNLILKLFGKQHKIYFIYNPLSKSIIESLLAIDIVMKNPELKKDWYGEAVDNGCIYQNLNSFPHFNIGYLTNFSNKFKYELLKIFVDKYKEVEIGDTNITPVIKYLT